MKPLCIADTSSLIYLSEVELAGRSLHRWLWDEFKVRYSQAVWEEIQRHAAKMGRDARTIKRDGERYVWNLPRITTCEQAIFAPPFYRVIEVGRCRKCRRPFRERRRFEPTLGVPEDEGERHNCCVALEAVLQGRYKQIIFLIDDHRAVRDYIAPILEVFPLGQVWSSLDFVLYLFLRHRKRIPEATAKAALRDVNAGRLTTHTPEAMERYRRQLREYYRRVERIDRVLAQMSGGH